MNALHSVSVAKVAELLDLNNLTKEIESKGEDDRVLGRQQTGASALRIF